MLYVANNGETCKDQLCQHPECWQSNIRRVREAVRQRNGIKVEQNVNNRSAERFGDRERQETDSYSLPTLKIIDMTEDLITPFNSGERIDGLDNEGKHSYSPVLRRPACQSSLRAQAPHTTPASPSLPGRHANRWKEKLHGFSEKGEGEDEKMTTINFHEIYDYDEVCEDWQDMFISSAYLVWCPSKKKRRKKSRSRRASSAVSESRKGFKNPIEDMIPLLPERNKKVLRSTSSKVPTGGQPYSPCRSPLSRMYNFRPEDYISDGEYIMTLTKEDVPKSLIASKKILEQKPHTMRKDEQLMELKKSSSTKVLVDISATIETSAGEDYESRKIESRGKVSVRSEELRECARLKKRKGQFFKQASNFESRQMLPLPSIAIPWGIIPDAGRPGHCKNSIPQSVDLDVMMEPVLYLPRTVSGSRSGVCTELGGKREAAKERPRTEQALRKSESFEERNHLTSAYRISPKNFGTPAPTPATPGTRDSRRHRSGLRRTSTKDSLSRTRLYEVSETENGALGNSYFEKTSAVRSKSARARNDEAILEAAESNRETSESIGNELSKFSLSQTNTDTNDRSIEAQSLGLDKVQRDNESALSDRAVSPSSRTNIPSDIWAELHGGGGFDHRRINPRSNSDLRSAVRPRSLLRGYHSSLGLSIYSYSGESNWKPHPPKLPKSFTYMGVYKPTILPRMPAALTVVPAPSSTRPCHVTEPREVKIELSKMHSIHIPAVPTVSPVPNIDIATASSCSTEDGTSAELFNVTMKKSEETHSFESSRVEEFSGEKTPVPEEDLQESEFLISREIAEEPGVKFPPHPPLDSEDGNAGTDALRDSQDTALVVEKLQDLADNDKSLIEDTQRLQESIAGGTDEFVEPSSSVTCITCPKPEVERTTSEAWTKIETVKPSMDEISLKHEISCSKDEISCSKDEIPCTENDTTCIKGEITCAENEGTCSQNEVPQRTTGSKEDVRGSAEKITCTKDESEVTCSANDATCTNEVTCDAREENVPARDNTPVGTEIDKRRSESISDAQKNGRDSGGTSPSNIDDSRATPDIEISMSPDIPATQNSLNQSRSIMQGSFRSLMFPEDMRPILSDMNLVPKVPSDFELTPFNVESQLLKPIEIDSDLLVLSDSFMDLSFDGDMDKNEGGPGAEGDEKSD